MSAYPRGTTDGKPSGDMSFDDEVRSQQASVVGSARDEVL